VRRKTIVYEDIIIIINFPYLSLALRAARQGIEGTENESAVFPA